MPLLCRWAELTAMCEAASVELQAAGMLAPAGVGYSPWLRVYLDCTKALSNLALRRASARKVECRRHRGGRLGRSRILSGWN
jgi:hypothetical protein